MYRLSYLVAGKICEGGLRAGEQKQDVEGRASSYVLSVEDSNSICSSLSPHLTIYAHTQGLLLRRKRTQKIKPTEVTR